MAQILQILSGISSASSFQHFCGNAPFLFFLGNFRTWFFNLRKKNIFLLQGTVFVVFSVKQNQNCKKMASELLCATRIRKAQITLFRLLTNNICCERELQPVCIAFSWRTSAI